MHYYIKHNSWEEKYRKPFGAVVAGQKVFVALEGEKFNKVEIVLTYFDDFKEEIELLINEIDDNLYFYYTEINIKEEYRGLLNYCFRLYKDQEIIYYSCKKDGIGGEGKIYKYEPKGYQITVYESFETPKWFKEGIVYQIFVDRFRNANKDGKVDNPKKNSFIYGTWGDEPIYIKNDEGKVIRWDFFGGNLRGVMEKLEYLKNLGIDAIYMNPIFEASSNHKYDTGDYKKIDPMFGNDEIFKELCSTAEKLGIRIILDGVFSHTGSDSIYFNKFGNYESLGAYQSKESPYFNWYKFIEYPEKYQCWWGIDNHPDVNEMNEDYIKFIIMNEDSVISKWMGFGVSGWRLDVADELPDEFIKRLKKRMREIRKDSVLIGEVWEDASNKISYSQKRKYLFGEELDSVTNYPFKNSVINFINHYGTSEDFVRCIMSLYENYPNESFYCNLNVLGTHDTERILTLLQDEEGYTNYKLILALVIQMTMPGVPLIYYGDEVGIRGGKDPLNRKSFPWGNEDMTIYNIYKSIIALRKSHEVFVKGDLKFNIIDDNVLCYERNFNNVKALIIVNREKFKEYNISLKDLKYDNYKDVFDLSLEINENIGIKCSDKDFNIDDITIGPLEFKIFMFVL